MASGPDSKKIRAKIEELVEAAGDKTICPSEVARALDARDWRELMVQVRLEADELKSAGKIRISQKGKSIASAQTAKGPIRLGSP
jgi:hypothetical protein